MEIGWCRFLALDRCRGGREYMQAMRHQPIVACRLRAAVLLFILTGRTFTRRGVWMMSGHEHWDFPCYSGQMWLNWIVVVALWMLHLVAA